MEEHDFLFRAILTDPQDDALRLVYSDWLEENSDAGRAEFIRIQCALAALDWNDPRRYDIAAREESLLAEHWRRWDEKLRGLVQASMADAWHRWSEDWESRLSHVFFQDCVFLGNGLWNYHRGFVEHVTLSISQFVEHAPELFRLAPIWALTVFCSPGEVGELASCPHLTRLRSLKLECREIGVAGVRELAFSPNLARLTELKLDGANLGDAGVQVLASSPYLAQLTHLDLAGNEIGDAGALALACSPSLGRLAFLHLGHNNITDAGVWALVESPYLRRPIRVVLYDNLCGRNEALSREWPY